MRILSKIALVAAVSALTLTGCASSPAQPEAETSETEATILENTENTQSQDKKYIALTFDDGPNTTTTNEVLDVLEKYGVVGSFFLIGDNINDESAKAVKRAYDMGCEIESHSKTHSYMDKMTADEIKAEMDFTSEKIVEITGEAPKFFRPPYIAVSDTMFDTIEMPFIAGYGCNDWVEKMTAEMRYKKVMAQVKDGAIILMHDAEGNSQTVEALDMIIPDLLEQGYELVTIFKIFEVEGVTPTSTEQIIYSFAQQTEMYG